MGDRGPRSQGGTYGEILRKIGGEVVTSSDSKVCDHLLRANTAETPTTVNDRDIAKAKEEEEVEGKLNP